MDLPQELKYLLLLGKFYRIKNPMIDFTIIWHQRA